MEFFSRGEAPQDGGQLRHPPKKGFYNGLTFTCGARTSWCRGGDPKGTHRRPRYTIPAEFNKNKPSSRAVARRVASPDSAGSQFHTATQHAAPDGAHRLRKVTSGR